MYVCVCAVFLALRSCHYNNITHTHTILCVNKPTLVLHAVLQVYHFYTFHARRPTGRLRCPFAFSAGEQTRARRTTDFEKDSFAAAVLKKYIYIHVNTERLYAHRTYTHARCVIIYHVRSLAAAADRLAGVLKLRAFGHGEYCSNNNIAVARQKRVKHTRTHIYTATAHTDLTGLGRARE